MVFCLAISLAYWLSSHDFTGLALLLLMAVGLSVVVLYIIFGKREANLGELPDVSVREGEGERVSTFVSRSPWRLAPAPASRCF